MGHDALEPKLSLEEFAIRLREENLIELESRVFNLFGAKVIIDISVFANSHRLRFLALRGSYFTTQKAADRLVAANDELAIWCNINSQ